MTKLLKVGDKVVLVKVKKSYVPVPIRYYNENTRLFFISPQTLEMSQELRKHFTGRGRKYYTTTWEALEIRNKVLTPLSDDIDEEILDFGNDRTCLVRIEWAKGESDPLSLGLPKGYTYLWKIPEEERYFIIGERR